MLDNFNLLLEKFPYSNKETLAKSVINLLNIEIDDLINYSRVEKELNTKLSDSEKFKLEMLYRTLKFNSAKFTDKLGGGGDDCDEDYDEDCDEE